MLKPQRILGGDRQSRGRCQALETGLPGTSMGLGQSALGLLGARTWHQKAEGLATSSSRTPEGRAPGEGPLRVLAAAVTWISLYPRILGIQPSGQKLRGRGPCRSQVLAYPAAGNQLSAEPCVLRAPGFVCLP